MLLLFDIVLPVEPFQKPNIMCYAQNSQWDLKFYFYQQNSKFAVSLQYLKKEVRDEVDFLYTDEHQKFYKLVLLFLMEVARDVQSTQNRKLVRFLQYIKQKVMELLLCSVVM